MKPWVVTGVFFLLSNVGLCSDEPYVYVWSSYLAKINEPATVRVYLVPPSHSPVSVEMEATWPVEFSEKAFKLKGNETKSLTATIKSAPASGLVWINGFGDNGYNGSSAVIDVGFEGHLKSNWSGALVYGSPTTLSLAIVDNDGKPIPFEGDLELKLDSADGLLDGQKAPSSSTLTIPSSSRATPQFQLSPLYRKGGSVHLTGTLTVGGYTHVLAQEQFAFVAQPASWIPVVLAIFGGLLHAAYKIVRMPWQGLWSRELSKSTVIVVVSSIAGVVAYLFADFDLLGIKLDPNVLRTYPILGFLFSYFGIEALLSKRFSGAT